MCFPLDYMHLVCLGVVKKLLSWVNGPPVVRLGSELIENISVRLLKLVPFIPCEFQRKPRSLSQLAYMKATEYRQILLYTRPIVLNEFYPILCISTSSSYTVLLNFCLMTIMI